MHEVVRVQPGVVEDLCGHDREAKRLG